MFGLRLEHSTGTTAKSVLPPASPQFYRAEIDGLRAIAVGDVILNHFNQSITPSGYLGVDMFFVISGYVISHSLLARRFTNFKEFIMQFYARRFKRLLPNLIICTVTTSVFISCFNPYPAESLRTGIFALFGFSNLYLLHISNDYFGGSAQLNGFTQTWSLGIEEQFYLIYPFILWRLLNLKYKNRFKTFYVVITGMGTASFVSFTVLGVKQPMDAFYLMPVRFWELAVGCLLAMMQYGRNCIERTDSSWPQNVVFILIIIVPFCPPQFGSAENVAVVILTAAGLARFSHGSLSYNILMSKSLRYFGVISYSLYLWHWPILVIGRLTIGVKWWSIPILAGVTLFLAHFTYHLIEKPFRTHLFALTNDRTVLLGGAALGFAAGILAILSSPLDGLLFVGKHALLEARTVQSLSNAYKIPRTSFAWFGPKCILATNSDITKNIALEPCTLGDFNLAPRRIMVFGNSFSAAFVAAFDDLVRDDHYAVTITSSWGAEPIGGIPNHSPWSKANAFYWDAVVPHMISQLKREDWVFLVSDLNGLVPQKPTLMDKRNIELYQKRLRELSSNLGRTGLRLAVLDVMPFAREADCKPDNALPQWFAPGGGPCKFLTRATTVARRQELDTMLRQLQREHLLAVIDPIDVFCPNKICTFLGKGNLMLYRDEFSHPSVEAARATGPLIRHRLTSFNDIS